MKQFWSNFSESQSSLACRFSPSLVYNFLLCPASNLTWASGITRSKDIWSHSGIVSPGNHEGISYVLERISYSDAQLLADCTEIPLTSFLCPPGQANFTDFMKRFVMPTVTPSTSIVSAAAAARKQAAALAVPPFWFSFDYGTQDPNSQHNCIHE